MCIKLHSTSMCVLQKNTSKVPTDMGKQRKMACTPLIMAILDSSKFADLSKVKCTSISTKNCHFSRLFYLPCQSHTCALSLVYYAIEIGLTVQLKLQKTTCIIIHSTAPNIPPKSSHIYNMHLIKNITQPYLMQATKIIVYFNGANC